MARLSLHSSAVMVGGVAACALVATIAAGASEFPSPPPNLLFQLQRDNRSRPWLYITTDSTHLTLKARTIDETGLRGLRSRTSDPLAPDPLRWTSISRIDEVLTRAHTGKLAGILAGGVAGGWLGSVIGGRFHRVGTDPAPPFGPIYSQGHPGIGMLLGAVMLVGVGAWGGGQLGERMTTGMRSWYIAVPHEPSAPVAVDTSATVGQSPSVVAPPPAGESVAVIPPPAATSPGILAACARIDPDDLIRLRGDFGEIQGHASVVGPGGLENLRVSRSSQPVATASVPTGRITWERIDRVHKRGNGWRKGALVGGIAVGAFGAVCGYTAATQGIFEVHHGSPAEQIGATAFGLALGGAVGGVLGAGVGTLFPAWLHVYVRPGIGKAR